ncbi:cupredoxin domain-containing protein [Candidatus Woesearchaeota archaeon]|nr:cupredoxin domain-containing protein [Candidatus Woesearchaeota archaeon]
MKASYLLILLVVLLLIGCAAEKPAGPGAPTGGPGGAPAEEAEEVVAPAAPEEASVDILADAFDPDEVTVSVGATVTWTNTDTKTHIVAGPKRLFSENVKAGDSFSFTFEEAGEYKITDVLAPIFSGTVVVE